MKYGKKVNVRFRYKMDGREPVEKQVYRYDGYDVIYDDVLGNMYANTELGRRIDRSLYARVSVGLLFDLAKRGDIDVWQFSAGTLIWMTQGGKETNMIEQGCDYDSYDRHIFEVPSSFTYQGHTFTPHKTLRGGACRWEYMSKNVSTKRSIINPSEWNYDSFYAVSTDKKCDLFECDGDLWIPAKNYLFLWIGKA